MPLNIHSLRNKLTLLEAEIEAIKNIDIMTFSETWHEQGTEGYYNISGFASEHLLRQDGYGGLSIFVKSSIDYRVKGKKSILGT
jgi:exonuclease III